MGYIKADYLLQLLINYFNSPYARMAVQRTTDAPPPYSGVGHTITAQTDVTRAAPQSSYSTKMGKPVCECQCSKHERPASGWHALRRIFSKNKSRNLEPIATIATSATNAASAASATSATSTASAAKLPNPPRTPASASNSTPKHKSTTKSKPKLYPQPCIIEPYLTQCGIQLMHLDPKYHSTEKQKDSPWMAQIGWQWKEKGDGLTVMPSWRDIIGRLDIYDEISVVIDLIQVRRKTWRRHIRIEYIRLPEYPYQLTPRVFLTKDARPAHKELAESVSFYISVYSRDLDWLKSLSRSSMGALISMSTAVQ